MKRTSQRQAQPIVRTSVVLDPAVHETILALVTSGAEKTQSDVIRRWCRESAARETERKAA